MSTIVTRAVKGSPLSNTEMDANLTNLNTDKIESGNTVAALTINSLVSPSIDATTVEFNNLSGQGSVSVTDILDQDDLSGNSATALATQQSIKAYVDNNVTAQDLDITDGSNTGSIDLDSETLGLLGGTGVNSNLSGNNVTLSVDDTVAILTSAQTLSNKTLTSPVLNTGISGSAFLDEDDLSSNSATKLASQQSIKAYVDNNVTAQDLDGSDGSNAIAIDLDSETLSLLGGGGIDSAATGNQVTFSIDNSVTTLTGSQTLTNKTLTSPDVNNADIDGGTIDGATIATSDITVGSGKTLNVSSGTLTLADNQISGDKVEGGTINATTVNTLTFGNLNDGSISIDGWINEADMASNSATKVPTQQSIKSFITTRIDALTINLSNVFVSTWLGSNADLGSDFTSASPFSIEPSTALRSDLAFDTGTYDLNA